ncbi:MAG: phytanoyl-CoA dioxygenase family protein [Rubripirellula sp.]
MQYTPHGSDPTALEEAVEIYNEQGALWISGLFDRGFVEAMAARYQRKYASRSEATLREKHAMVGDRRYMISVDVKAEFNSPALYANPSVMSVLSRLLGEHFVISSFGSVLAFPGADAQPVHCDYPPLYPNPEICVGLPPHAITLVVPLVDIDETTGGTAMWLGTHRQPNAGEELERLSQSESIEGAVCLQPKMGDAFLMDYRLIHAGSANRSNETRPIMYIVYSRPWFREDLNFKEQLPIKITKKQFKKVPKSLRYLFASARLSHS